MVYAASGHRGVVDLIFNGPWLDWSEQPGRFWVSLDRLPLPAKYRADAFGYSTVTKLGSGNSTLALSRLAIASMRFSQASRSG
jgi:hypothetical protein